MASASRPGFQKLAEPKKACIDHEQDQGERQQRDRERRGELPVKRKVDLLVNEHRNHLLAGTAQEARRNEVAKCHDEDQQRSPGNARHGEWDEYTPKGLPFCGTKVVSSPEQRLIDAA